MKAIKRQFYNTVIPVIVNPNFHLFFIIWLAACPIWGQANFGVKGHFEDGRVTLELDSKTLQVPMLLVRHGAGQHQVTWSKKEDVVFMELSLIPSGAGVLIPPLPKNQRVYNQLLGRYPIIQNRSLKEHLFIDITDLFFKTDIRWSRNTALGKSGLNYVGSVVNLKNEVIVRTHQTVDYKGNDRTIAVDFSFYKLPEPMKVRLFDHRMGYHSEGTYSNLGWSTKSEKGSIQRWRLEKRDVELPLSPPVNPIVFYLDTKIPKKWKAYVKAGIESWLPAFEAAGFTGALEVREWNRDEMGEMKPSVGRSVVQWAVTEEIRGRGLGGSTCEIISDYRTGEILSANIIIADPMELAYSYFVRCSPLDERAQQFPFPDDLMGELIQYVTAHEAGHAFGLKDGNYGEYAYPFERIRDIEWLKSMGHVPSIMSYSRHHHIAQPEDGIPPSLLIQGVGPMDRYQIKWGYMPIPDAVSPDAELPFLNALARQQDSVPWYRFTLARNPSLGPGDDEEVADNDDPIASMALGLKNLERVVTLLPSVSKGKRDDGLLEILHGRTLEFWFHQMSHVLSMVGGYDIQYKNGDQTGLVYTPISPVKQEQAVQFLLDNAFAPPPWLTHPPYLGRLHNAADRDRLLLYQVQLLKELMAPYRWKRLEFMEDIHGHGELGRNLLSQIQKGIFKELDGHGVVVDRRRQNLQRTYLALIEAGLAQQPRIHVTNDLAGYNSNLYSQYTKSALEVELKELLVSLTKAMKHCQDPITKGHLSLCYEMLLSKIYE
ncbi:zinc-dependent metalloprotease [Muricauda sp. 334s03]|uniref:Zinc-dependent metalloprotease n=1 Tax=Flagellimonas yonaguniensis TaxID=3031325 RepID=A0ABT5Y0M5_9FLAO|nr:zinc-dependent metalloprotease [[Muricauda] yonaguniensis]MDF0716987.1 zinc-dependent metalloprotease [[Muricauda] yonaguniensis]